MDIIINVVGNGYIINLDTGETDENEDPIFCQMVYISGQALIQDLKRLLAIEENTVTPFKAVKDKKHD